MNISIGIAGPAGAGINTVGIMLSQILADKGYSIYGDKEYESRVRGGSNIFVVYISDEDKFVSKQIDYLLSFDEKSSDKYKKVYNIKNIIQVPNSKEISYKNIYSLGIIFKILNIDIQTAHNYIKDSFDEKHIESNIKDLTNGYSKDNITSSKYNLNKSIGKVQKILSGNEIIGKGAMKAGMDFYAAYPMTPASSIIEVVSDDDRVTFFQGEDEMACSIAMLGAKFTGKRAMTGTSGGGFALMTESIGYSIQAEIGGVYVLSQRTGPSTGTPTYTEQGNINFAINSHFGGIKPIVIAPSDFYNGYYLISKALNISDKYQHPVVVLIDKQFSESFGSIDKNKLQIEPINKGKLQEKQNKDFARYEHTKDGISPWSIPGQANGEYNASSYEHDIYGATTEKPEDKIKNDQKRSKKIQSFIKNEFNRDFKGYEIINSDANKFIVSLGINKLAISNFLNKNPNRGAILIEVLNPINPKLKEFLETSQNKIDKITFVELNKQGQLQNHITSSLDLNCPARKDKINNYRKSNLYPLFKENLENNLS